MEWTVKFTVIFEVVNKQVILGGGMRYMVVKGWVVQKMRGVGWLGKTAYHLGGDHTVKNLLCSLKVHLGPQHAHYRKYPSQVISKQPCRLYSLLPVTTLGQFWWSLVAAGLQIYGVVWGGPGCDPICPAEGELWSFLDISIQQIQSFVPSSFTLPKLFESVQGCWQGGVNQIRLLWWHLGAGS